MTDRAKPERVVRTSIMDIPLPFYLLPLLLIIVIPAAIARENEVLLSRIPLVSVAKLLTMAVLVFLALAVIRRLLVSTGAGAAFGHVIEFVLFFVVVTGFFFPVVRGAGMVEASEAEISIIHLAIGLAVAVVMALISHATVKGRETLYFMLLFFVAANIGVGIFSEAASLDKTAGATNVSATRSVFVLSFDGVSGSAVSEVLTQDPNLESSFEGFVFYEEAASSSPATSASIAAELLGNQDFKETSDTEGEVWDSSPNLLLTNVLATHGYDVTTYGEYGRNLIDQSRAIEPSTLSGATASNLLKWSVARSLGGALVPRGRLANVIDGFLRAPTQSETVLEGDLIAKISASQSPDWSKDLGMSMIDFRRYLDQLTVDDGPSTAHFLHFTHTHYPVELDSECAFRGDDAEWYRLNQDREGVVAEARCALRQFGEFVDRLREMGIYDQSVIVLKSDHGKPVDYGSPDDIESFKIKGHEFWGYGRYAPFLAVKPSFSEVHGLDRNMAPVLLDDLAKTLCAESGIEYDCDEYPGYNIVRESNEILPDSQVTVYVVDSNASDFRFDTHVPITVTRGEGVLGTLYAVLTQSEADR